MSAIAGDLSGAVLDCSVPLIAIRFTAVAPVNGRVVAKPEEDRLNFEGSFQPLSDRELRQLPEGQRNEGRSKIYTPFELKTVETSASKIPDRVLYKGVTYKVVKVNDWIDLGGYFKTEVVRMGQ